MGKKPVPKVFAGGAKVLKVKSDPIQNLKAVLEGKDGVARVLRYSDDAVLGTVKRVCSTGSIAVDQATQIGGFPYGRITEIYGDEAVGKTTLLDCLFANSQKNDDGTGICFDPEHRKDVPYSTRLGVDPERLIILDPPGTEGMGGHLVHTMENVVEAFTRVLHMWLKKHKGRYAVIGWDSLAATALASETGDDPKDKITPGETGRTLRRAMRVLTGMIARAQALVAVTNQQYAKIGGRFPGQKSTYGGGAFRYHSTIRMEMIRTGWLETTGDVHVGITGIARAYKNSSSAPREEKFAIEWGRGFNDAWSILEKLKDHRVISENKGWFSYAPQGQTPVTWQGGWRRLGEMMIEYPAFKQALVQAYRQLP